MVAERLCARVGSFRLHDVSFSVSSGRWGIVLGPTGSGKTTLLETIAGVRRATSGSVRLRNEDVSAQPPERRGVGIVYQHSYLFPHLSVAENVGYGTRDKSAARDVSARFGVDALYERSVSSLSGGERQVVALARALATRPDILLLDEPFAALDPRRRGQVRRELRAMQQEAGTTVLHVTHDFAEAGTLGDVAMVLENGRLTQFGPLETLFRQPATGSVAEFLGAENVYAGVLERVSSSEGSDGVMLRFVGQGLELLGLGDHSGGAGHAVIRGADVLLARERRGATSARNVIDGVVAEIANDGILARVTMATGATTLVAVVTQGSVRELGLAPGAAVVASIKATAVHLC